MPRKKKYEILEQANVEELFEVDEYKLRRRQLLENSQNYADDERFLPEQRKVLLEYLDEFLSKSTKATSICNIFATLNQMTLGIKKPFKEITRQDMSAFCRKLRIGRIKEYSPRTIASKNTYIMNFFKWYYKINEIEYKEDYPSVVCGLSKKAPRKELLSTDMLTQLDIRKMVESCHTIRDKTILMMLYEMGCRARELTQLKLKDVIISTHSIDVTIQKSKSRPRVNTLINSYVYLQEYLNRHPHKGNGEAPLFVNLSNAQFGRALLYQGLLSVIRTARKRARIKKKVHPHLFRHSRATELASKGWREAELREWFGWSKTSDMPTVYVHIGQSDVKNKMLKEHGLLDDEESMEQMQEKVALQSKTCVRCGKNNPADALTCNCGMALSIASVEEIKKLKNESDGFMDKLNSLPLRPELIAGQITPQEYKKKLIQSDPFLKSEFEKIAKEMVKKLMRKEEIKQDVELVSEKYTFSKTPVTDKYQEAVLDFRNKGWPLEVIAKHLGIGYGTVYQICKKNNLTQIY
jgi:site-specific recombinase XerD